MINVESVNPETGLFDDPITPHQVSRNRGEEESDDQHHHRRDDRRQHHIREI